MLPAPPRPQPVAAPAPPTPLGAQPVGRRLPATASQQPARDEGDSVNYPRTPKLVRTGAQMTGRGKGDTDDIDFFVRTELPDPGELFRRDSEGMLFERIRQEARKRPGAARVVFPTEPVIGKGPYEGRHFAQMVETVEPSFVCHRRLLFEQPNFERQCWDVGAIQPGVHLLVFYYDILMLPYHIWERPCDYYECSSGKCLPGDPTPMLLYRERFSLTGLAAEAATWGLGGFFFR
jgi:hypothetical protein